MRTRRLQSPLLQDLKRHWPLTASLSSKRIPKEEYSFQDRAPQQVINSKKPGSTMREQRPRGHPEKAQEDSEDDSQERSFSVHCASDLGPTALNLSALAFSLLL